MKRSTIVSAATLMALLAYSTPVPAAAPPDAGQLLREQWRRQPKVPEQQQPVLELPSRVSIPAAAGPRVVLRNFNLSGRMVTPENASELLDLLDDARGRRFDLAGMEGLAARVTRYYRDRGYLLARAYLPAQEIRNGTLKIAVLEGSYGHVDVHNTSRATGLTIDELWPGDPIEAAPLERELLLLSDIPGIVVRSALKPGADVGTSDLHVDIAADRRFDGAIEIDNYGDSYSGEYRGGVSLNYNNPTGAGDRLSLRANSSGDGMSAGTLDYLRTVGGNGTRVGATVAHVYYSLGADFSDLDAHGAADIVTLYGQHAHVRSRTFNLNSRLALTEKSLSDEIGAVDSVTEKTVSALSLTLSGNSTDFRFGGGVNSFSVALAGGNVEFDGSDAQQLDRVTANTQGGYATLVLNALRLQRLGDDTALFAALSAQFASKNLVSSERFSLGGPYGVRAYPVGEASGDEGVLLTLELRHMLSRAWQLIGFVDGGQVTVSKDPWLDEENDRALYGYGVGVNWYSAFGATVRAAMAFRLGGDEPLTDDDRSPRIWIQATQRF